jgi:large subunit ribosomal protein L31e
MATKTETKKPELEREYIIPLRNEWRKVANYRRTGKAVKFIKQFIARHMNVPDRDISKVKLDMYLNNEIWFRGRRKPPARIKVRAIKEGDIVRVELAEVPDFVKFIKQKHDKRNKPSEMPKGVAKPVEEKEEKSEEQVQEEKKEESEKEKSVAQARESETKQQVKAQKHLTQVKEPKIHRMALKK